MGAAVRILRRSPGERIGAGWFVHHFGNGSAVKSQLVEDRIEHVSKEARPRVRDRWDYHHQNEDAYKDLGSHCRIVPTLLLFLINLFGNLVNRNQEGRSFVP
jgi:hypothetical protein